MTTALDFTARAMKCTRCRRYPSTLLKKRGKPRMLTVTPAWYPPRGWAGAEGDHARVLMIVTLNPGAPQGAEKAFVEWEGLGSGCCSATEDIHRAHAAAVLKRCTDSYVSPPPGHDFIFHRRSVALARAALRALGRDDADWLRLTWFTDLYKCSTPSESSPEIPTSAIATCRPWLDEELALFRPSVVLALGGVVEAELTDAADGAIQADPRVVPFPHPSPANSGTWQKLPRHVDRFDQIRNAAGMEPMNVAQRAAFIGFLESLGE
jgi:uracil-DNA glycosylase